MRQVITTVVALAGLTCSAYGQARMNQIQVLGSHNSYKEAIDPSLFTLLKKQNAASVSTVEYFHPSLSKQLDHGLRSLEIDVVYDPQGGRFARPRGLDLVKEAGLPAGPPYDPQGVMSKPGFKVLHMPDVDFRTNAYTLQDALAQLRAWSDKHPRHLPIVITMNAKDSGVDRPGYTQVLQFDEAAYDAWDAELRKGLGSKLITPDEVRGKYKTLEAAALAHAWPELDRARGRFLFVLDENAKKNEVYLKRHPSLSGRVMFVNSMEGSPEAAFRIVNEPIENISYIHDLVRRGYLVRTRADADTKEARKGDYTRWKAALQSGAHIISTDYYLENPEFKTGYKITLPGGGPGLWNPLLLPGVRPLPDLE